MSSAALAGGMPSGLREVELSVQGMTCAACAARVEKKLNAMDNVSATVNFATEKAGVTAPESVTVTLLIEEIKQAGYGAEVIGPAAGGGGTGADDARVRYLRRRLIVALVFLVPLTDLSVLLSLFPAYRFPGWQWVLVALTAPVAGWAAWPFHQAALENARHGTSSMDTLVSLGITAARISDDVLLRRAGAVEQASGHPVAAAIAAFACAGLGPLPQAVGFVALPGLGAQGAVDGHEVIVAAGTGVDEVIAGRCRMARSP